MLRKGMMIVAVAAPAIPGTGVCATIAMVDHAPGARDAQSQVKLAGDVFVERFERAPGGRTARVLERAEQLHHGDRLVFVVSWSGGTRNGLTVTNPVPQAIAFQPAPGDASTVSVDGGQHWGTLATLMVHDGKGWRPALPEDVTHIRWRVAAGSGQITYRGIVR
jgi:hypothetical protein